MLEIVRGSGVLANNYPHHHRHSGHGTEHKAQTAKNLKHLSVLDIFSRFILV
jgi:hypothetical protein